MPDKFFQIHGRDLDAFYLNGGRKGYFNYWIKTALGSERINRTNAEAHGTWYLARRGSNAIAINECPVVTVQPCEYKDWLGDGHQHTPRIVLPDPPADLFLTKPE